MATVSSPPLLRVGPSGWSHPDWDAAVFPRPKPKRFHALDFLSEHFDVAEITSTFDEMPKPEQARLWARRVAHNPAFEFTAKLPRVFSHERDLSAQAIRAFLEGIRPLREAGRLGCVLAQFPWSFRLTQENRDFLVRLRRTFGSLPLAAEMRHASWTRDEAVGVFMDNRIAFCNIDQPEYVKSMPPTALLTAPVGYIRLHGRNCYRWFLEARDGEARPHRYDYLYSDAELAEWRERIDRIRRHAARTYVVFNNDTGGQAVVNALQMQALLGIEKELPRHVVRRFPAALETLHLGEPVQRPLFGQYGAAVA